MLAASAVDPNATADPVPPPLLGPDDGPAVTILNPDSVRPLVLTGDHASNRIPAALGDLGLPVGAVGRHIAYDIGVGLVMTRLAERLRACAVIHNFSRLVVDPNRNLDDPTLICVVADGAVVDGNRDLTDAQRQARIDALYTPYHDAIDACLEARSAPGAVPVMVAVHSYTAHLKNGVERPWEIGVLWDDDGRIPVPLIAGLRAAGIVTGDNQPYDGRNDHGFSTAYHGKRRGLAHVLVEFRQDLIADAAGATLWADRFADVLAPILADEALTRPRAA